MPLSTCWASATPSADRPARSAIRAHTSASALAADRTTHTTTPQAEHVGRRHHDKLGDPLVLDTVHCHLREGRRVVICAGPAYLRPCVCQPGCPRGAPRASAACRAGGAARAAGRGTTRPRSCRSRWRGTGAHCCHRPHSTTCTTSTSSGISQDEEGPAFMQTNMVRSRRGGWLAAVRRLTRWSSWLAMGRDLMMMTGWVSHPAAGSPSAAGLLGEWAGDDAPSSGRALVAAAATPSSSSSPSDLEKPSPAPTASGTVGHPGCEHGKRGREGGSSSTMHNQHMLADQP